MRLASFGLCLVGAASLLGACAAAPSGAPAAVSVQRYATPAAETERAPAHGYSADARRIADCLASYPNYDVRRDRIEVQPGVTRPCPL